MRILILVTGQTLPDIAARRGDYPAWIQAKTGDAWPGEWATVDVRAGAVPGARDADAFVLTGSSSSVTERAPWMLRTEALVRDIAAAGRPVLGICFGHQLIAQALGGEVTRNPLGREMGAMRVSRVADDDRLFAGLPRDFDIHGTHVDAVVRLPPGGEVLATTPKDPVAAFRVGPHVRGVQFHPEFDADVMRGYLQARREIVRSEGGDPDALLAGVHVPTRGETILRNFAASVAGELGRVTRSAPTATATE